MSGIDNLAGIDFQVSYCVHRIFSLLRDRASFVYLQFEGLDDEGQDFKIQKTTEEAEYIQVKKRGEGYLWTASSIRPVIEKFIDQYTENSQFVFFTDGSLNPDLIDIRDIMSGDCSISNENEKIKLLQIEGVTYEQLTSFLGRFHIQSRQFVSSIAADPAARIREDSKLMLKGTPFAPFLDVEFVYHNVWTLIFESSKNNAKLTYEEILNIANSFGLYFTYSGFPSLKNGTYIKREESIDISGLLEMHNALFIYGLSGTGKSTAVAHAIDIAAAKGRVLWFSVSHAYESRYFRKALATFLESNADNSEVEALRDERLDDADAIGAIFDLSDITVVFDSVENASSSLSYLWQVILRRMPSRRLTKIIFVGQALSKWYIEAAALEPSYKDYHLRGFDYEEFVSFMGTAAALMTDEDKARFYTQTGGLPLAANLLRLNLQDQNAPVDASKIVQESTENIHRLLFSRIISGLSDDEREFVEAASVFGGDFTIDEINILLERPIKSRAKVFDLTQKCIVTQLAGGMKIHDSIRPLAYALLFEEPAEDYHKRLAEYYLGAMETQGALFELIDKWGFQVEKCSKLRSTYMESLISLDPDELFALWGIYYAGFPFAFSGDDLIRQYEIVIHLTDVGLIEVSVNFDEEEKTFDVQSNKQLFRLREASPLDGHFLWYLAQKYTPAYHMGYIDINMPNFSWQIQCHTICPWEHRIEFEPLIPHDEDLLVVYEWFSNSIKNGDLYWRGETDNATTLAELEGLQQSEGNVADDSDLGELVGSCPIFGHCCPGGRAQARICAKDGDVIDAEIRAS